MASEDRELEVGDTLTVITIKGKKGNIIGYHTDGRTILFDRYGKYNIAVPAMEVKCKVVRLAPNYIIADPVEEPVPLGKYDPFDESLLGRLNTISKGDDDNGAIAKALLEVIERLEKLSRYITLS